MRSDSDLKALYDGGNTEDLVSAFADMLRDENGLYEAPRTRSLPVPDVGALKDFWEEIEDQWDDGELMPEELLAHAKLIGWQLAPFPDLEGVSDLLDDMDGEIEEAWELIETGLLVRADGKLVRPGRWEGINDNLSVVYNGQFLSAGELGDLATRGDLDLELEIDVDEEELEIRAGRTEYKLHGEILLREVWIDNDGGDGERDLVITFEKDSINTRNVDYELVKVTVLYNGEEINPATLEDEVHSIKVEVDNRREEITVIYDGSETVIRGNGIVRAFTVDNMDVDGDDLLFFVDNEPIVALRDADGAIEKARDLTIVLDGKEVGFDVLDDNRDIDVDVDLRGGAITVSTDDASITLRGTGPIEKYYDESEDAERLAVFVDNDLLDDGDEERMKDAVEVYFAGTLYALDELPEEIEVEFDHGRKEVILSHGRMEVTVKGDAAVLLFGEALDPAKREIDSAILIVEDFYNQWQDVEKTWDRSDQTVADAQVVLDRFGDASKSEGIVGALLEIEIWANEDGRNPWKAPLIDWIDYLRDDMRGEYDEAMEVIEGANAEWDALIAGLTSDVNGWLDTWQETEQAWRAGEITAGALRDAQSTNVSLLVVIENEIRGKGETELEQLIGYFRTDMADEIAEAENIPDDHFRTTDSETLQAVAALSAQWKQAEVDWAEGTLSPEALIALAEGTEQAPGITAQLSTLETNGADDPILLNAIDTLRRDMKAELEQAQEEIDTGTELTLREYSVAIAPHLENIVSAETIADSVKAFLGLPESLLNVPAELLAEDTLEVIRSNPDVDWDPGFVSFFEEFPEAGTGFLAQIPTIASDFSDLRTAVQSNDAESLAPYDLAMSGQPYQMLTALEGMSEAELDQISADSIKSIFAEKFVKPLVDSNVSIPVEFLEFLEIDIPMVTTRSLSSRSGGSDGCEAVFDWVRVGQDIADSPAFQRLTDFDAGIDPAGQMLDVLSDADNGSVSDLFNGMRGHADSISEISSASSYDSEVPWEQSEFSGVLTNTIQEIMPAIAENATARFYRHATFQSIVSELSEAHSGIQGTKIQRMFSRARCDLEDGARDLTLDAVKEFAKGLIKSVMLKAALPQFLTVLTAAITGGVIAARSDLDDDNEYGRTYLTVNDLDLGGDDVLNFDESQDGLVISGVTKVYDGVKPTVTISFDGQDYVADVEDGGLFERKRDWSVEIPKERIPDANDKEFTITVLAEDDRNDGNGDNEQTITVRIDTVLPALTFDPVPGLDDGILNALETEDGLTLTGTAEAGSVVEVSFNGKDYPAVFSVNGGWSVMIPAEDLLGLSSEEASFEVTATDAAGNVQRIETGFTIDTVAPFLMFHPFDFLGLDDGILNANETNEGLFLSGAAEIGAAVTVTFNGTVYTTDRAEGSDVWSVRIPAEDIPDSNGEEFEIAVTAVDAAGNESVLTERVLLDVVAPDLTVTARPGGEDGTVPAEDALDGLTFAGTSEAGAIIKLTLGDGNSSQDFEAVADATGAWTGTIPANAIPEGVEEVTVAVEARDAAGNITVADPISLTLGNDVEPSVSGPLVFSDGPSELYLGGTSDAFLQALFPNYTGSLDLLGGDDVVRAEEVEDLVFNLGDGHDTLELINSVDTFVGGGDGRDDLTIDGGSGNLVQGGNGADTIRVTDAVETEIRGEKGKDTFEIGDGVDITVWSGSGADTIMLEDEGSFDVVVADFDKKRDKIAITQAVYDALSEDWAAMVSVESSSGFGSGGRFRRQDVQIELGEDQVLVLSDLTRKTAATFKNEDALDDYFEIY